MAAFSSTAIAALGEVDRVAHGAVHLRHAAERVGVLHPPHHAVRREDLRVVEQPSRSPPRPPGRAATAAPEDAGVERRPRPASASSVIAPARCASFRAERVGTTTSAPIAAMNCVPLMSEIPSFGPSVGARGRRRAAPRRRGRRSPSMRRVALADERRARGARAARGRRSPPRCLLRTTGGRPAFEHRDQRLDELGGARRNTPWRSRSRAAASSRAPSSSGKRRADAARRGCARGSAGARRPARRRCEPRPAAPNPVFTP